MPSTPLFLKHESQPKDAQKHLKIQIKSAEKCGTLLLVSLFCSSLLHPWILSDHECLFPTKSQASNFSIYQSLPSVGKTRSTAWTVIFTHKVKPQSKGDGKKPSNALKKSNCWMTFDSSSELLTGWRMKGYWGYQSTLNEWK